MPIPLRRWRRQGHRGDPRRESVGSHGRSRTRPSPRRLATAILIPYCCGVLIRRSNDGKKLFSVQLHRVNSQAVTSPAQVAPIRELQRASVLAAPSAMPKCTMPATSMKEDMPTTVIEPSRGHVSTDGGTASRLVVSCLRPAPLRRSRDCSYARDADKSITGLKAKGLKLGGSFQPKYHATGRDLRVHNAPRHREKQSRGGVLLRVIPR